MTGEIPAINHKERNPCTQRWGLSRKARPEDASSWFVTVLSPLTVQAAGFLVPLGPARAALVDSLLLHPVHLLVNRVVPRPVGKGSVRAVITPVPLTPTPPAAHCTQSSYLQGFFFQPPSEVLAKSKANTANCILITSNSSDMLWPHTILENLYSG